MLGNCSLLSRQKPFFLYFRYLLIDIHQSRSKSIITKNCDRLLSTSDICRLISIEFDRQLSTFIDYWNYRHVTSWIKEYIVLCLVRWKRINYLPWKKNKTKQKKHNQSLVVLIDGPLSSPSCLFSLFMLLISCSTGTFIRPLWWQILWVASKNLALRSRRSLVRIWILMIVCIFV